MKTAYFKKMVETHIDRYGIANLMRYLESTDFYDAPASTKFHLNRKGGLCEHSCNVFDRLETLCKLESEINGFEYSMESVAIIGLFHDLCKVNYYSLEMRDKKIDGKWSKVPVYDVKEPFPFGHGEKSVFEIRRFMELTDDEALAIRWHMGPWDEQDKRTLQMAMNNPLVVLTQTADMQATFLDEVNK